MMVYIITFIWYVCPWRPLNSSETLRSLIRVAAWKAQQPIALLALSQLCTRNAQAIPVGYNYRIPITKEECLKHGGVTRMHECLARQLPEEVSIRNLGS